MGVLSITQKMPSTLSKLHHAAATGSVERTLDFLSRRSSDIDRAGGDDGWTPLMFAADVGYLRVIKGLLRFGAGVSVKADRGHTALHNSVCGRHLAVSKAPIKAGADLGAKADFFLARPKTIQGHTPLHLAAGEGFCEGMVALIDVGANVNSRLNNGATPLHLSASCGKLEAVNILLWAKANPLLPVGISLPFDVAAQEGHLGVMHELSGSDSTVVLVKVA